VHEIAWLEHLRASGRSFAIFELPGDDDLKLVDHFMPMRLTNITTVVGANDKLDVITAEERMWRREA
jgi:hypothetical protein